ncbi:MAG: TonB family protein [Candidatus Omnitrophica bacterium]|nr:TonB family protein [Candidatus Omnitrophota bacterium]
MDRIFFWALVFSFVGHLLVFLPWAGLKNEFFPRNFSEIEISYFEVKPKTEEIKVKQTISAEEKKVVIKDEIKQEAKQEIQQVAKEEEATPSLTKEEEWVKRDFSALSKEPTFLDYYRAIREKIKNSANRNKPLFFKPGEVCVFFVLDNSGNLRRLKIIEHRSSDDLLLRETAFKSVEEASPFPPFPPELKREQIAFNIIIAFEVR